MKRRIKKILYAHLPDSFSASIIAWYRFFRFGIIKRLQNIYLSFFFKEPTVVTLENSSLKLYIDPRNGVTDQTVFLHHSRDDDVVTLMKENLSEGSTYIDIGANIGYETVYGALFVGKTGKVFAFEPLPHLARQLTKNIELNGFKTVTVIQKALGNKESTETIYLHAHDAGSSSMTNKDNSSSKEIINVTTLDSIGIEKADFIKIDVEGYEPEVFLGARELLLRSKPKLVFEFQPHLYKILGSMTGEELLTYVHKELGYTLFQMLPHGLEELPPESFARTSEILEAEKTLVNIFAH